MLTKGAQKELRKFIKKAAKVDPRVLHAVAKSISPDPSPWRFARPSYLRDDPEVTADMRARRLGHSPAMVTKSADPTLKALEHLRTSYVPEERELYFRAVANRAGRSW